MTSDQIKAQIQAAAAQYGVDPGLALGVAQQESSLNPGAVNTRSGATGLFQLEPATFADMGGSNIFDPAQNINAGVKYLSQMLRQFGGDVSTALAAYNWGPGNVQKYLADPAAHPMPAETRSYVPSVLNYAGFFRSGRALAELGSWRHEFSVEHQRPVSVA